jgi:hypothetical protein
VIGVTTTVPSLEGARRAFDEAEAQDAFWEAHILELMEKYPDQFVAVRDGVVVATSPDLLVLLDALKAKGLGARDACVRYMETNPGRWAL